MKTKLASIAIALFAAVSVQAQNISQDFSNLAKDIGSATNWTAIAGYGHSTAGNKNVVFADVAYNFNANVGVIVGYDYLFGNGNSQANIIKGGVSLSATIHPFAFIGSTSLTNIVAQPFVADLLATPKNSSVGIGNIVTTGINFDIYKFKNFELDAGIQYENRTGQGFWNGSYILGHIGISRKF